MKKKSKSQQAMFTKAKTQSAAVEITRGPRFLELG